MLIATLGAEPQVISLATQLLLRSGVALTQIIVVHTDATLPPMDEALPALQRCFGNQPGWPPLTTDAAPVADVLTPAQLATYSDCLYAVIKRWVAKRAQVHLLLAGGRKPMAMLGISLAQMLLGPDDHVWYLHSDETLRRSGRMLLGDGDQAQLLPIPLPRVSPAPPSFLRTFQAETPAAALDEFAAAQQRQLHWFVEHELTAAEREVALLVAQHVLTVKEIAHHLNKNPETMTKQLATMIDR
ncbi:MAG TPA: CRISPR-associated ring nuclease [Caldilineaceae bacterium]|nr:CRISPR-associated ring nuclease [Caldilineaceae bacterium]